MANLYTQRVYDNSLLLKAAALVGSTADGTLILDLGNGLIDADLILDVTAIETDTGDESYAVILEGSPDATFGTATNIAVLSRIVIGHHSATAMAPQGFDSTVGRYCVCVRNELNGTTYRYARIRTVVAGTVATGINYMAWLSKDDD